MIVRIPAKYFDAMKRELFEETGIKNFEVIKEIEGMTEYELPDYLLGKILLKVLF